MNELTIKGKIISTPILDILTELKKQLQEKRIDKLAKIIPAENDVRVTCPYHKQGKESKPSCGIALYGDATTKQGIVHCFTCGTIVEFPQFVSDCFNIDDRGEFGEKWLIENFVSLTNRDLAVPALERTKQSQKQFVDEATLRKYRFTHPYHYKRGMTDEIIEQFDLGYNISKDVVTFPVWDQYGRCVFIAERSVAGKFFHYPEGVDKPVYALNKLDPEDKEVIVVESFFNCLTLWKWGYRSVALLGLGSESQYEILRRSSVRHFILCFDGDEAGKRGERDFIKALGKYKMLSTIEMTPGKDVNDLTLEEFEKLKFNNLV